MAPTCSKQMNLLHVLCTDIQLILHWVIADPARYYCVQIAALILKLKQPRTLNYRKWNR